MGTRPENIEILYQLSFRDGSQRAYRVELDGRDFSLEEGADRRYPDWAKLEYHQCPHCPLSKQEHPYCPVAKNLAELVDMFKDKISYEEVDITVETKERTYYRRASLQVGLFSIYGLIMSTADCPHMDFLKPMARFHLPFSSTEETLFRVTSLFLLRQYFTAQNEGKADFSFRVLEALYQNISLVNRGMLARIGNLATGDANVNSITILESFGQLLQIDLLFDLSKVRPLFVSEKSPDEKPTFRKKPPCS
jgi:hypothetical protein